VTPRRLLTLTLLLAAVVAGATATAGPAAAATKPCWKRLINDWYDGRIDKTYPASCYRAAVKNLPEDVDAYSTAREDLERALLAATRRKGGTLDPNDPIPPGPGNAEGPKA
jgi:predicted membrane-bound mannosyltransferase